MTICLYLMVLLPHSMPSVPLFFNTLVEMTAVFAFCRMATHFIYSRGMQIDEKRRYVIR